MPLTDSIVVVTDYIYNKLVAAKTALAVADVWYGDQVDIPRTPALCVEPGPKNRVLHGVPRRSEVNFSTYILVYHGEIRSVETNRRECDLLAEAVELLIHQDPRLGDNVIHSMATSVDPGYANRAAGLYRVSRIVVESLSQVQLPTGGVM